ncbi:hypothetical protein GLW04_06000 [Halobacillus litoralis]|uniref:Uncharacterized protein n=1 Tax=Halobacillus litoralis TaxID=45668 RepID=A0A845DPV7_9BACI|nr:hypothetical protein [Halobacillus litoralis]MYL19436.1 hypothetical protein [Halobacillus litoralis]MYL37988.1 hypothetical protein [Halobacillus litoralis]
MAVYWYAWVLMICIWFFMKQTSARTSLLFFLCVLMCTFSWTFIHPSVYLYAHLGLLMVFGLHLLSFQQRPLVIYFWLFFLSIGFSSVSLFITIHPVWTHLPGFSLGVAVVLLLRMILSDLRGIAGFWLTMNGAGMTLTYVVLRLYGREGVVMTAPLLVFALKGLLILLFVHGLRTLKKNNAGAGKSKYKGDAYA